MTNAPNRPILTRDGVMRGARMVAPVLPGVFAFGSAYGVAALQKGLTLWQTLAMSALTYSGVAQIVALELWRETWTLSAITAVVVVTATLSARMILMGAALQPWLSGSPRLQTALNLFLLTDANWLLGLRYHGEGGRDVGVLFGAGALLWVVWIFACLPGYLAGALLTDPRRFGLDLVMPLFFAALIVPIRKNTRSTLPWLVAGAVALTVQALVPGYMFIVAGALAGALTGGLIRGRR
jgi:predicted branched-subunit amino acid permease